MDWVEYFYNIAEEVKKKSKDKNTQIGAVIVGKDRRLYLQVTILSLEELMTR